MCLLCNAFSRRYRTGVNGFRFSSKVEKHFEKILKEKKGFVIKKTVEDGACLFRAVGRFLWGRSGIIKEWQKANDNRVGERTEFVLII